MKQHTKLRQPFQPDHGQGVLSCCHQNQKLLPSLRLAAILLIRAAISCCENMNLYRVTKWNAVHLRSALQWYISLNYVSNFHHSVSRCFSLRRRRDVRTIVCPVQTFPINHWSFNAGLELDEFTNARGCVKYKPWRHMSHPLNTTLFGTLSKHSAALPSWTFKSLSSTVFL